MGVLTFALEPARHVLNVVADRDGLVLLRRQLDFLLDGSDSHIHLMTASWGGNELDEGPLGPDEVAVHAVNIGLVGEAEDG